MIYLDNAATTLKKPDEVVQAVVAALTSFGNAGRGATDSSLNASRTIYQCRCSLAELFGIEDPRNIAFTSNSTEALNIAIAGLLQPSDHCISSQLEHNSVLRPLYAAQARGAQVTFIASDRQGKINLDDVEEAIRPNTKLVVMTHGSNLTGNVVDIAKVGKVAHDHGLIFVVDASQTAGVIPIDVKKQNIDVLCFTGHKSLYGPQGTGGIYVNPEICIPSFKSGGTGFDTYNHSQPEQMPTRLEAGTLNSHGIAGLLAGVQFIQDIGIKRIYTHENRLMTRLYEGLSNIEGVRIYGDFAPDTCRCPVVSINIRDYDSSEVADELLENYGISTRPGAHCAPLMHEALGTKDTGAVRFSLSYFNTCDEIDAAIAAVSQIAQL